jgi:hypothetical protein
MVSASAIGMSGDYACYLYDRDYLRHGFTTTYGECYVQFWYLPTQAIADQWVCGWWYNDTLIAHARVDTTTKNLRFYRGESTLFNHHEPDYVIDYPFTPGTIHKIYIHIIFDSNYTSVQAWVDGVHTIQYCQDPTHNSGSVPNKFGIGGQGSVGAYYDNIILGNAELDTRSPYQIFKQPPTGVGTSSEWTPTGSSNWSSVANIPLDLSKYVATNTVDRRDLYATENLPTNKSYTPGFLQVQGTLSQDGSPTPTHISMSYRTGGATTDGTSQAPNYGGSVSSLWTFTDPNVPHTNYLDDLEIGIRART